MTENIDAILVASALRGDAESFSRLCEQYYSLMSYGRIAQMLGISEEAVNGRLRRARDTIRHQLQRRASTETEP